MSEPSKWAVEAARGFNDAKPVDWTTWDSFAGKSIMHSKQPSLADWIQQAIDAATAAKDKEIASLLARMSEFETANRTIFEGTLKRGERISAMAALLDRTPHIEGEAVEVVERLVKRISGMATILDTVPHFHSEYKPEDQMDVGTHECVGGCPKCASDCPRCAWERMKKEKEK